MEFVKQRTQQARTPGFFLLVVAMLWLTACAPQIGDACESSQDCPSGVTCERSVENGFCTIRGCRPGGCPSESICVSFDRHETFCMRSCSSDDDCRRDHVCIDDEDKGLSYCFVDD